MRTNIADVAIAGGTAGTVLLVRLADWFEVQVITGHTSQCSPRPLHSPPGGACLRARPPTSQARTRRSRWDWSRRSPRPRTGPPSFPRTRHDPYDTAAATRYEPVPAARLQELVRAHGGENATAYE